MGRRLAALDCVDALQPNEPAAWRAWSPDAGPRPRTARTARRSTSSGPSTAVSLVLTLAVLAGAGYAYDRWEASGSLISGPPVPDDAQSRPLGTPPPGSSDSTDYVFMSTLSRADDTPVAFDPCRPIHVVVNTAQAPIGADRLLAEAMQRVTAATGLVFTVEGETLEPPRAGRPNRDVARYGNRWSPVLVAWTEPSVVPELTGTIAGIGGPVGAPYSDPRDQRWVSGIVYLDGPAIARVIARPNRGWEQGRAIVMHELAHLVGLTHVDSRAELMHAKNDAGILDFGAGDREGLRRLGQGRCFTR